MKLQFIEILDDKKAITELQAAYLKETKNEVNYFIGICSSSKANQVLKQSIEKMNKTKLFRKKITTALAEAKQKASSIDRSNSIWSTNTRTQPISTKIIIDDLDKWSIDSLEKWSIDDLWKLSIGDLEKVSMDDIKAFEKNIGESIIESQNLCYADKLSELDERIKDIEGFLKKIDAEIQPARRAMETCDGPSVLSGLGDTRKRLMTKQCNSSPGISVRLLEINLLENALAPENCSSTQQSSCDVSPTTEPVKPGKYYKISESFHGSDGAAHCFTAAEAKAKGLPESITVSLIGDGGSCSRCPEGFMLTNDHNSGAEICVQCPDGMRYGLGCCFSK